MGAKPRVVVRYGVDRYLERIGYTGGAATTLATLPAPVAHQGPCPFENLDVFPRARGTGRRPNVRTRRSSRRRGGVVLRAQRVFGAPSEQSASRRQDVVSHVRAQHWSPRARLRTHLPRLVRVGSDRFWSTRRGGCPPASDPAETANTGPAPQGGSRRRPLTSPHRAVERVDGEMCGSRLRASLHPGRGDFDARSRPPNQPGLKWTEA